jgi:hypothetical protein
VEVAVVPVAVVCAVARQRENWCDIARRARRLLFQETPYKMYRFQVHRCHDAAPNNISLATFKSAPIPTKPFLLAPKHF